ncbi:MAG: hypothetical protein A2176_12480 [Spirochaetes bacterium RBG_13_51_14]|nr:MAG: hypothetical protein A2176_12480 [Spirochaetes bacterium RBG_13_51_14]
MEKRNTTRVPFHVRSVITYQDRMIEGDVVNLSTGGMLFNSPDDIPIDEIVHIEIILYGSSSRLALNITGRVVRRSDKEIAIKFTELDLDSFIHLKNIVSRNALEEEKILKEFKEFSLDKSVKD